MRLPQEPSQPPAAASTDVAAAHVVTAPPSVAASPEQPSAALSAAASAAAVVDLQSQLRDTQSSLASHLDKVRALEGVLAEQEVMKREVRTLREMMEERRIERDGVETAHLVHQHTHSVETEEPRGGFDLEEDEEDREIIDDDSDDDAHSITSTVVPHELERVEEEDEDQLAEEERRGREDLVLEGEKQEEEDLLESEEEERERRREDLGLGRPRTPEPSRMGLDYSSLLSSVPRRAITPPLSQQVASSEDVYDQVQKLSKQVTTVMALTTTLEAQHSAAQTTIQALESKVEALEGMLKIAEEALKAKTIQEEEAKEMAHHEVQVKVEEEKNEKETLTQMLSEWKKSVEGQWGHVQEEWKEERERLKKAREEWESKLGAALTVAANGNTADGGSSSSLLIGNGDVFKHNGLVAPPSPQSQSSNSPRYRRRRKRATSRSPTGERGGERGRSMTLLSDDEGTDPDADTDATLANSDEASSSSSRAYSPELMRDFEILKEKRFLTTDGTKTIATIAAAAGLTAAATTGINKQVQYAARTLATPEPSVYKLSSSMTPVDDSNPVGDDGDCDREQPSSSTSSSTSHPKNFVASVHLEDLLWRFLLIFFPNLQSQQQHPQQHPSTGTASSAGPSMNFHTAVGVLVLSVAAAAVFWKVKPE